MKPLACEKRGLASIKKGMNVDATESIERMREVQIVREFRMYPKGTATSQK